jgi:hypothetical protein
MQPNIFQTVFDILRYAKSHISNEVYYVLLILDNAWRLDELDELFHDISVGIDVKRLSNPCSGLDRPNRFQEVEAPRFYNSRYIKVISLSILSTGRLYRPGNIPGTHFC